MLRLVAVGYVLALVAVPVLSVAGLTFGHGPGPVLRSLRDPDLLAAARLGLLVAAVSTLLNTVFGVAAALLLVRREFPGRAVLGAVIDLPVSISPVVVGIALVLLYGRQGPLGGWLVRHGVRIVFATPGLVLATVIVSLPLVVRAVVPVLAAAGTEQEEAACCLGAGAVQRFGRITLPTIWPALGYGIVLTLARSLGEFGALRVVSGSVAGQSQTLTLFVHAASQQFGADQEQAALTAALALMLLTAALIAAITRLRPERPR